MKRFISENCCLTALFGLLAVLFSTGAAFAVDNHPVVRLETSKGNIRIELYEDKAPITVTNFLLYVAGGFYDGADGKGETVFHRVMDGFMIQGGGFTEGIYDNPATAQKATLASIQNEAANGLSNDAYTIAMARTTAPHSATSQFFINVVDNHFLNYQNEENMGYAVFGKVIEGSETVDAIKAVSTTTVMSLENVPEEPVVIRKAAIENLGNIAGIVPKLRFPLVISGNSWETEIGIINTSGTENIVGTLQAFDLNGKAVSDVIIATLPPNGRNEIRVGELFSDMVGYIAFSAATDTVSGYSKISLGDEYRMAVPAAKDSSPPVLHIPLFLSTTDWWTAISLLNITDEARTVEIVFNDGTVRNRTVGPGHNDLFLMRDLFGGETPAGIISASINNTEGIIALQAMGSAGTTYLTGNLISGATAAKQYFPRVLSDENWFTAAMAYNPSGSECEFSLKTYTADGIASSFEDKSVGNQGGYLGLFSSEDIPENTAWFELESKNAMTGESCPVSGSGFFGSLDGKVLASYSSGTMVGRSGLFPKLEKDGYSAAVLINTGFTRARVSVTAYNDAGTAIASSQIVLDSRNSTLNLAEGFFGQDISGATYIRYDSDKTIAAFQATLSGNGMMLDAMAGLIE